MASILERRYKWNLDKPGREALDRAFTEVFTEARRYNLYMIIVTSSYE